MADLQHNQGRLIINASWFHTREEWDAREPKEVVKLNTPAQYVVLIELQPQYYCDNFKTCSYILQDLQEYHTRNCGLSDIAYNYLLSGGAVGEIYEGRGAHIQGQHTDGFNAVSLGIGFMDDYASDNITTIKKRFEHFFQFLNDAVQEGYLVTNYRLRKHKNITIAQNVSQSSDSL
ncbi:peptidoglycan recognition protein 3-like [Schistocerca gregaria]|uniref:peptidoglycan recognition protein 3-like n=1 Tax=Schistocerca gregaria TaxID=7010 RepID=UPI00211DB308|nr:peptidoglycan recognition protein 3-like [Schistocerca gregaria]